METVSFVIGVAQVLSVFQSCMKTYSDILSIQDRDEDVRASLILVQIELFTFCKLREFLCQESSTPQPSSVLCNSILEQMKADLASIFGLLSRHKAPVGTGQSRAIASKGIKRLASGMAWISNDKQQLRDLITRLHQLNDGLGCLVSDCQRRRMSYEVVSTSIASDSLPDLEKIQDATSEQYPEISQGAEVKRMTLRSRGAMTTSSLGKPEYKLCLDNFEWSTVGFDAKTKTKAASSSVDAVTSMVSLTERSFAVYRNHSVHQPSASDDLGTLVMVEWRDNFRSEESTRQFEHRLDYLVKILCKLSKGRMGPANLPGPQLDGMVHRCLGWTTSSPQFTRIGLVFSLPSPQLQLTLQPILPTSSPVMSLNEWMTEARKQRRNAPALGYRFDLAYSLCQMLGRLISVGWVHKEFRSHNILFPAGIFESQSPVGKPYIAGLTYARPSNTASADRSLLNPDPEYSLYRPSNQLTMNYQQQNILRYEQETRKRVESSEGDHNLDGEPDANPAHTLNWTSALDIYGLGIVLLEIGLWKTIRSLKGDRITRTTFVAQYLDELVMSLSYRMGDIYQNVVRRCLNLGDWVDEKDGLPLFFANTIEQLALCKA